MGVDPLATIMALPEPAGFAGGMLSVSSKAGPLTLDHLLSAGMPAQGYNPLIIQSWKSPAMGVTAI